MENSAYVPSHLSSPALVVFSQAAGGLTEALRIQRPFHSQVGDGKDMHLPLGLGLRHMEAAYGAHLLHHLPPQFLHPALDGRAPFGSGAFRPLGPSHGMSLDVKPFPSAFTPPARCNLNIDSASDSVNLNNNSRASHLSNMLFSPGMNSDERFLNNLQNQNASQRTDSSSPASVSLSPPAGVVKEESLEGQMSEDGQSEHSRTPGPAENERPSALASDEPTGFRIGPLFGPSGALALGGYRFPNHATALSVRTRFLFEQGVGLMGKKVLQDPTSCPICGATLGVGELEGHFMEELERLYKLSAGGRARRHETMRTMAPSDSGPDGRWETFQRIKTNRQSRLRIKTRKRKSDETNCPVCHGRLQRSPEELNAHVEHCLRKNGASAISLGMVTDEDEPVDVEGDSEMFEDTPSWPEDQRRIRATSLLVGLANSIATSSSDQPTEENERDGEDLVVDGDDSGSDTYRPIETTVSSQYVSSEETEILSNSSVHTKKTEKRKDSIISMEGVRSQEATVNSSGDIEPVSPQNQSATTCDSHVTTSDAEPSSRAQVLEELRARIRELEGDAVTPSDVHEDQFKCIMCMEHYKKPVISKKCWHLYCEECWFQILNSNKNCPECNATTTFAHLRRVNM